jgi:hypothetical protein
MSNQQINRWVSRVSRIARVRSTQPAGVSITARSVIESRVVSANVAANWSSRPRMASPSGPLGAQHPPATHPPSHLKDVDAALAKRTNSWLLLLFCRTTMTAAIPERQKNPISSELAHPHPGGADLAGVPAVSDTETPPCRPPSRRGATVVSV